MKTLLVALSVLMTFSVTIIILTLDVNGMTKTIIIGYVVALTSYWILTRHEKIHQLQELTRLRAAYEQLDRQAKLIIRTDLELHRTQEELDRKLASLVALHELGQQLRISVHPDEIYGKLNAQLISSFGFSKGLVGICSSPTQLNWRALIGVAEPTADQLRQYLLSSGQLQDLLAHPSPRKLDADGTTDPHRLKLLELLGGTSAVIAGITPHTGPSGCLLLAREGLGMSGWRGDEELVEILVTQLIIALENSALYEELWHSRQELEQKIHERTRELASANTQLLRLNKAKSDFVSVVSHELRTPLAAIKGYASLLRSGQFGPLALAQAERVGKIEKHTDLLTQLINNLLDIARIESGRVTMEQKPLDARELVSTALEAIKPQLDAKRITFHSHVDGIAQLVGDRTHLPRVLINLLSNATKYTPEGGSITLTLKRQGPWMVTTIQDTGCGIAADELPKLFQEFYRTVNAINEQVKGTGLGLALVKRIVEAHHGQITVHSELGNGTTFIVQLPLAPAPVTIE